MTNNVITKPKQFVTVESLKEDLPVSLQNCASQEIADILNTASNKPEELVLIRDNFLTYVDVIASGRFKATDYTNAVKYVTFKLMGNTNREAYAKTFPKRYEYFVTTGKSNKDISSYVSAYNANKLVTEIEKKAIVPHYIMYQDIFSAAVQKSYDLMMDDEVSPVVQQRAADSLMGHLRIPDEIKQVGVNVDINLQTDFVASLEGAMGKLAQAHIESGNSVNSIINTSNFIEVEIPEDE